MGSSMWLIVERTPLETNLQQFILSHLKSITILKKYSLHFAIFVPVDPMCVQ